MFWRAGARKRRRSPALQAGVEAWQTRKKLAAISARLKKTYGSPRLGNVREPFGELLYILLSSQTHEPNFKRTWANLKKSYPGWSGLAQARIGSIRRAIVSGGLGNWKARLIKKLSQRVTEDFGSPRGLEKLKKAPDEEAEAYLSSLPGVKIKSARCVMMYSFDHQVFPVDANVFRITKRLGLIPGNTRERPRWVHDLLQELVPEKDRYDLHVNMVAHGRAVCKPQTPLCHNCTIRRWCAYGQQVHGT